jgi:hypothetical protein
MTKAKEVETEIVGGAGATARLILKRKPNTKSGYYGVIPNGKGWRARVYKETKKSWDSIGTYTTAQEAAIAVAIAEEQVAAGNGSFYSPEKQRASTQEGASPASAISPSRARTLLHTLILTAPSPAHRGTFRSACDRAFPTSTPTPPHASAVWTASHRVGKAGCERRAGLAWQTTPGPRTHTQHT